MEISRLSNSFKEQSSTLPLDSLLSYLSQIVLSETDKEIKIKQLELDEKKIQFNNLKENLRVVKNRLVNVSTEENRLNALYKVLRIIRTLKKEGLLVGNNRAKIDKILGNIHDQEEKTLITLLDRLTLYLPD